MISVEETAADCKAIPAAKTENEWSGAESHFYNPRLAKKVGREGAIVLRGLAWKVKRSKNEWDGGKGYYETLENLVKLRFPYFSTSGLWGITTALEEAKELKRGTNNKRAYDRTTWYSMSQATMNEALEDEGAVGFDVRIATSHGLPAALAFHHVRYHLRELAQSGNRHELWHKVNKANLARVWDVNLSTVKRAFDELVTSGVFSQHPTKPAHYSISEIGAFLNLTGANLKMGTSANLKMTGANLSLTSANLNETGANLNNYTHWKPLEIHSKTIGTSRGSLNEELCQRPNPKPEASSSVHKLKDDMMDMASVGVLGPVTNSPVHDVVMDTRSSSVPPISSQPVDTTVPVPSFGLPKTFQELKDINLQLFPAITHFAEQIGQAYYDGFVLPICEESIHQLPEILIDQLIAAPDASEVMVRLIEPLKGILESEMKYVAQQWNTCSEALWPLVYYPALEVLTRAFRIDAVWSRKFSCTIDRHWKLVDELNDLIVERRELDATVSVERKVQILKEAVELRNKHGWIMKDDSSVKNAVCVTKPYLKQISRVIELNPHLATGALISVLWECIWWSKQEPEKKEHHWWSRQGADLGTFCRKLDLIVQELGMREECAVVAL